MKRLVRKADFYDEKGFLNNEDKGQKLKDRFMESAKHYCEALSIDESSIEIGLGGSDLTVEFGKHETDGFLISISAYSLEEVNRIMVSSGKSQYKETREQRVLDQFLDKDPEFFNWIDQMLEELDN